jgi:UDP-2,3-diacylglucosamine pyrophosphatase LpxH
MRPTYNIVVISDLHLGEDLSVDASEQSRLDVGMASVAAADYLAHLTQRRVDGRPWKLVCNGDTFDFLCTYVGADGSWRAPAASAGWVDRIAERHAVFFRSMARFLIAGNHVDLVAGNHDRELTHPLVTERVRAALRAHGVREVDLVDRLRFHDWFVHEPGVAWIEHGHQYDDTCSFEFGLAPENARGGIIPNVDAASVRFLGSVASVDPHSTEEWTLGGYVKYAASLGWQRGTRLALGYGRVMLGLWAASRAQRGQRARRRRAHLHDARLEELAQERGVPVATLRDLDGLRRMPITRSMARVCSMLQLNRMALTVLTAVAALTIGFWGGWPWGFVGLLGVTSGGYVVDRARARRIPRDPTMALATVPDRIHRTAGVPIVVFGHTHVAMRLPLSGGGVYVNSGTWLPAIRPGLLRAFTHVVILHGKAGPEVHLRQWRDGRSGPFAQERITPVDGYAAIAA